MKIELRVCPHCGGPAAFWQNQSWKSKRGAGDWFCYVKCDVCGCQTGIINSDTEPAADNWENAACTRAAKIWNLRTTDRKEGE